jgi:hypothetical protein
LSFFVAFLQHLLSFLSPHFLETIDIHLAPVLTNISLCFAQNVHFQKSAEPDTSTYNQQTVTQLLHLLQAKNQDWLGTRYWNIDNFKAHELQVY